ncbi:MAG TPA: GIY-YIG nuclease family protein [Bacteroidales bacterium]|nr:GIY-YIG nuclease family protein [Bacteroidales bacterium]HQN15713.1 GIY-YIG nuclease family protein [Bacteroidales bacterium]
MFVYALESLKDGRIYVGQTQDIEKRLKEHNQGRTKSTKAYAPWRLIFQEECEDRQEARVQEKYWKSGCGKEKLKVFLKNNFLAP